MIEFIFKTYLLWILEVGYWILVHTNCQFIVKETTIVPEKQDSWQTFLCFMAWSIVQPHSGDAINYWDVLPWTHLFIFLKTFRLCQSFAPLTTSTLFTCQKTFVFVCNPSFSFMKSVGLKELKRYGGLNSTGTVSGKLKGML